MRNIILWCLSILLVCAVAWLASSTVRKINKKKEVKEKNNVLHELPIFSMDSTSYSIVNEQKPIVLILFNTGCEHCQYEAGEIKKSIASFSQVSIVMVSSEPIAAIKEFALKYEVSHEPNITFCKIDPSKVFETFGGGSIPRIFIYGIDRQLIKEFNGETKIEAILKYLP